MDFLPAEPQGKSRGQAGSNQKQDVLFQASPEGGSVGMDRCLSDFFSPNRRKACLQMRNGREVACKVEDTGERGVSWKTRRIEIQSSHKGTSLDRMGVIYRKSVDMTVR